MAPILVMLMVVMSQVRVLGKKVHPLCLMIEFPVPLKIILRPWMSSMFLINLLLNKEKLMTRVVNLNSLVYGCVLWDLAASSTHAELMVQNLVLEVLLANLMVSQSVHVTIILGIIGNLACHEVLMKSIASTIGLIALIVDQLFLDDTHCQVEASRLLTLCLQGSECIVWAEALQSEHILQRILWIAENTYKSATYRKGNKETLVLYFLIMR